MITGAKAYVCCAMMPQFLLRNRAMLYVLDIDDILYLERNYVKSGFHAIDRWFLQNQNIEGFFEHAWLLFENGVCGNVFDIVMEKLGIAANGLVQQLVEIYRSHEPDISLLDDAVCFLESYPAEKFAIISDGHFIAQTLKLRALKLDQYVKNIVLTDKWGQEFWKPHHRAYLTVQGSRPAEECVYIADNPQKDFKAPAALGWAPSIRMRRKGSLHYEVETPRNCIEVASFEDLLKSKKLKDYAWQ